VSGERYGSWYVPGSGMELVLSAHFTPYPGNPDHRFRMLREKEVESDNAGFGLGKI
jgi:hypothetical protein